MLIKKSSKHSALNQQMAPVAKRKRYPPDKLAATTKASWDAKKIPGGVKLIIPENMPSLNQWKNWHWGKQDRYKKMLAQALAMLARLAGSPQFAKASVQVIHFHRVLRRRDEDNLAPKFLLDALCQAGMLVDDNKDLLTLLPAKFETDRTAWRTEVYLWGQLAERVGGTQDLH